ncbi:MAG: ribonuclease III [Bacteroidaceae bacterium]|nr:ribonuclease III [Bacteroidaceae bacterium]
MMEILDMLRLLFRKDKKPFLKLRSILGFYPHNIKLYRLALKHKSTTYAEREAHLAKSEKTKPVSKAILNNERLEFLGDAVLGAVVADILYRHYGTKQEGFLTSLRSKIVCRSSLNKLAVELGLDKLILYSGSVTTAHNSYMNGNAFEAFFGAIYLDRGYSYCYKFMEKIVFNKYINIDKRSQEEVNYKSNLIEWCQKYQFQFKFTNREMREGKIPKFHSELRIEGVVCGAGEGYSKKESDQEAAQKALRRIKREPSLKKKILGVVEERKLQAKLQSEHDKAATQLKGRKTVVFDLDGTLMNTLQDLFLSTNYALRTHGYPERTLEEVKMFVGNGVRKLMERAMPDGTFKDTDDEAFIQCFDTFRQYYVEHCQDNTQPYDGIGDMLSALREHGYKTAIVSNKLQAGVTELYETWFKDTVTVAIGESPDVQRKPSPDMVEKALEKLHSEKSDAVYVGDSDIDLKTAENAGLPCISVLWGFRDKNFLLQHGAKVFAEKPADVLDLMEK